MAFNLGVNEYIAHLVKRGGFDGLKKRDYKKVADAIRQSKAYTQLPKRYERLACMMETGQLQAMG